MPENSSLENQKRSLTEVLYIDCMKGSGERIVPPLNAKHVLIEHELNMQ